MERALDVPSLRREQRGGSNGSRSHSKGGSRSHSTGGRGKHPGEMEGGCRWWQKSCKGRGKRGHCGTAPESQTLGLSTVTFCVTEPFWASVCSSVKWGIVYLVELLRCVTIEEACRLVPGTSEAPRSVLNKHFLDITARNPPRAQ